MDYFNLFTKLHGSKLDYYRYWTHDYPMVISLEREEEIKKIREILYRCIDYYVHNYEDYLDLIDYDKDVLNILEESKVNEYQAGMWRPDFIVSKDGEVQICEITSRFFGNGYFLTYFLDNSAREFAREAGLTDYRNYFDDFLAYCAKMLEGKKKVCVFKSSDKFDAIPLFVPFFEELGAEVKVFEADEVENNIDYAKDSLLIDELNQVDVRSLSKETIKEMIANKSKNDFRSVFLVHDKRFFRLFKEKRFTEKFLSEEETEFLKNHTVETFIPNLDWKVFEDAYENKDKYILKHARLGKSEKVYPGPLCSTEEWQSLFEKENIKNMILQPFIDQKVFETVWQGKPLSDYATGTILTVDDKYFGFGLFRTSTRPVVNQTDAHKIAPVITNQKEKFSHYHEL